MSPDVGHLVIGPSTHGVVRCAVGVWQALADEGDRQPIARVDTLEQDIPASLRQCTMVHVHVTDRLFGRTTVEAEHALRSVVARLGRPISVTLHDIPQPSDGPSMAARASFFRAAASEAVGVVVSSRHEATLLADHVDDDLRPEVVPLMIERHPYVMRPAATEPVVGVLGFLYPGKGHVETMRALRDLPRSVGFLALGTPSAGHEHLADELRRQAAESERRCDITGFLDDQVLRTRIAQVTVPVAYHRHMSASGSINTWTASGRIPLVPRTRYTVELDARSPGSVLMHGDDDRSLRTAIVDCLENPESTWRTDESDPVPTPADVARQYSELFRQWAGRIR